MKQPKFFLQTGRDAQALRRELKMTQGEFWGRVEITQSGGSRYESGREISAPVAVLLHLVYAPESQAAAMFRWLRSQGTDIGAKTK